jgi:O-antigen/teichoic acid export membrane protein
MIGNGKIYSDMSDRRGNLNSRVRRSIGWAGASAVLQSIIQFIYIVIISRLVEPSEFGVYIILLISVGFFLMISRAGITMLVVNRESIDQQFLSTLFYLALLISALSALIMYIVAPEIFKYFDYLDGDKYITILSLLILFSNVNSVHEAILQRKLLYFKLSIRDVVSQFFGSTIGITVVYLYDAVLGLICTLFSILIIKALITWSTDSWRPRLLFVISECPIIFNNLVRMIGVSLTGYFTKSADKFLIGKVLGVGALGVYSMAFSIIVNPMHQLSILMSKVLFPAFSILNNENKLKNQYKYLLFGQSLFIVPLLIFIALFPIELESFLFDDKWSGISDIIPYVAIIALMQAFQSTTGIVLMAIDRPKVLLRLSVGNLLIILLLLLFFVEYGLVVVVKSYAVLSILMALVNLFIVWRLVKLPFLEGMGLIIPNIFYAVVAYYATWPVQYLIMYYQYQSIATVLVLAIVFVIVYITLAFNIHKELTKKIFSFLLRRNF